MAGKQIDVEVDFEAMNTWDEYIHLETEYVYILRC